MPTISYIAKAATPDDVSWRARIARNEKGLLRLFLAWVGELREAISDTQLAQAVVTGATRSFDHVLQAVTFKPVTALAPVSVEEAVREFDRLVQEIGARLDISLNMRDPGFLAAIDRQGANLVREVTVETRRAIRNVIARAYREQRHPFETVPELRQLVGLTARQAQAVMNFRAAQDKAGVKPDVAAARTARYADRMLTRRAQTIARTETAKAATAGRLEGWRQAAGRGLFDYGTAEMEWSSVQQDPTEICAQLDGSRVPLGTTWPGGLLPGDAHPCCRCAPVLILPSTDDMVSRLLARVPEMNTQMGVPNR